MTIEAELPDGRVLEFPDGTDPSVIQSAVKRVLGVKNGGVDNSGITGGDTVLGVVDEQQEKSFSPLNVVGEFAAGANEGVLQLLDFLGPDQFNAASQLFGSDIRVPTLAESEFGQSVSGGGFVPEGTTQRALRGAGQVAPAAIGGAAAFRQAATAAPKFASGAESISTGLLRTLGAESTGSAATLGAASGGGSAVGGDVGEAVGGEKGRAIGEIAGAVIAPLSIAVGSAKVTAAKNARKLIADEIKGGSLSVDNVTKSINEAGEIVTSKASKKALSNLSKTVGQDRATQAVSVIENMAPASKRQVNKMLDIVDAARKNPTLISRPSDVLGESVANRAQAVAKINKRAGKDISNASKALDGESVDITKASDQFFDDIAEMGVKTLDDNGRLKLDFSESTFVGGGKGEIEKIANFVKSGSMDGKKAHELKQFIRDRVGFGQGTESAVSARSQGPLKKLSSGIDEVLDSTSSAYKKANDNFAKTVDLRDQFQKMAGKDVDLMGDMSAAALGGKARRLVSNAESRINIQQQLDDADRVLGEFGVKFHDDIPSLNHTVTQLEDIFKITPAASLKGNIERGGANILQGASPTGEAVRGGLSKIQELRQPDFETQMKTLRALTRQKAK